MSQAASSSSTGVRWQSLFDGVSFSVSDGSEIALRQLQLLVTQPHGDLSSLLRYLLVYQGDAKKCPSSIEFDSAGAEGGSAVEITRESLCSKSVF